MGCSVFQFSHRRVFSSLVFGFRFLSMMAVSGFLCPMHFTVSLVFPIATCSRVKTVISRDHLHSVLPFLCKEWMANLVF